MIKSLKNLWGRLLFQGRGILPTKRLLICFIIFSTALTLLAAFGLNWTVLIIGNCLFVFASLFDLLLSPKKQALTINRSLPDELERGVSCTVELKLSNTSIRPAIFRIIDDFPPTFQSSFPLNGIVKEQAESKLSYRTVASVRGDYQINYLYLRYTSFLQLWEKQVTINLPAAVKVIPNLTATKSYLESARRFLLYEGMEIRKRQRGTGEFAQIRNFVVGDDARKINWRQTAKLQEVMTNEYEPEHGKYLAILIDCGRMMGAELKEGNRLEKTLEAALAVSAAALKNGDYVSILAFSKEIKVFIPPGKEMAHLQSILRGIYHLQVDPGESNYAGVLNYLQSVQKKRSLVLLFSDVQTFLNEESGLHYLKQLRKRHLFFMIGIEDETIAKRIEANPGTVQAAMVKSIAQQQMHRKKQEKRKWEKQGLALVEAGEDQLAAAAVSRYIDIMNRGLL